MNEKRPLALRRFKTVVVVVTRHFGPVSQSRTVDVVPPKLAVEIRHRVLVVGSAPPFGNVSRQRVRRRLNLRTGLESAPRLTEAHLPRT